MTPIGAPLCAAASSNAAASLLVAASGFSSSTGLPATQHRQTQRIAMHRRRYQDVRTVERAGRKCCVDRCEHLCCIADPSQARRSVMFRIDDSGDAYARQRLQRLGMHPRDEAGTDQGDTAHR